MSETRNLNFMLGEATRIRGEFDDEQRAMQQDASPRRVEAVRLAYTGRKGKLSLLMEELRNVPKEERGAAGKAVNDLRQHIEQTIEELRTVAARGLLERKLAAPPLDVTLPVDAETHGGSLHPVTLMRRAMFREFRHLGFTVFEGPEMELDFYNFSALNFPADHPARDMQDTFFVEGPEQMVMRTHTSNIQIHTMLTHQPPLRAVAAGRVYRCDSDLTHTPMFHQLEGFIVDRSISMAHLKGTMDKFLKALFGNDLTTRLRPSFFPFVEPGAEVDMQCVGCRGKGCRICKDTGWIEVAGCGMIHPHVFEAVGYDTQAWTGFAFGFGIDRLAMLRYSLGDLRLLFEGEGEFLRQFPVFA